MQTHQRIPLSARKNKEQALLFLSSQDLNQYNQTDIITLRRWCEKKSESFSEVTEKKYLNMQPVIDLTVEQDHSYVANGIVVHNCNLPKETTKELVSEVYMRAWKTGCKGFTIYRDGSRSGVLVSTEETKRTKNAFIQHHAPKRPKELTCDIYHVTVQGEKWTLFVGLLDGKPYEMMGGLAKYVKIPKRVTKGKLVKHNGAIVPARYDLHYDFENPEDETTIQDVGNVFENPTHSGFTRMVSLSLRHGTPIQFVVEQLTKGGDKESDLFSITKAFSRVLKTYIMDGTKPAGAKKCTECNSDKLAYKDGCAQCLDCGNSKCD